MKASLQVWKTRNLTFKGRVHLIKSVGIPSFLYGVEMREISSNFVQDIMKVVWNFVWRDKKPLIRREICTLKKEFGGIGMVDIPTIIKVRRIKMIVRLIEECDPDIKWNVIGLKSLKCLDKMFGVNFFTLKVFDSTDMINKCKIPFFYKECLLNFQELMRKGKVREVDENEIIWCNDKFRFSGKPVAFPHWSKNGIINIDDLM